MIAAIAFATLVAACVNASPQNYYSSQGGQGGQGGGRPFGGSSSQGGGSRHSGGGSRAQSGFQSSSSSFSESHRGIPVIGGPVVPIISDNRQGPLDGHYSFDFQTGDGLSRQEQGSPSGPNGAVVQQGSWSFTFPDGTPAQFSFVADEGGFRVDSPLIPTPHPLPAHAVEQIQKAERERAQGIVHDGQYRPEFSQGSSGRAHQQPAPQRFAPQQSAPQPQRFAPQQQHRQSNRQQQQSYYN